MFFMQFSFRTPHSCTQYRFVCHYFSFTQKNLAFNQRHLQPQRCWAMAKHKVKECAVRKKVFKNSQGRIKISSTDTTSPANQPGKDPFHLRSISPHLAMFQQSAGATPLLLTLWFSKSRLQHGAIALELLNVEKVLCSHVHVLIFWSTLILQRQERICRLMIVA